MKRKINCETARNFPVEKALEKLGHFPNRETEQEAWFLSPFRSETQASLKVSKRKNRWYDHGLGIGGNVIDLVILVLNCPVKDALVFLSDSPTSFSFQQQQIPFKENVSIVDVIKIQEIMHPALVQYLSSRSVPLSVAKVYCKQVWYKYNGNLFFAIGLENIKGGWELRNRIVKNCSSPKSYSLIKRDSKQLVIMEGMFDLFSLAVLNEELASTSDIIVLNSLAFIRNVEDYVNRYINDYVNCYDRILLYLDNDTTGDNGTQYLKENYPSVTDQRETYKNHKDLNEYLCHVRGS
ncbi:toprim domain-containing protein [Snuella lapsa]|uniref:Toprim domain-containing protein n=1 Tax=Snuella lapsa TaxID=870481 RepID=A0ABP6WLX1_9FLAO